MKVDHRDPDLDCSVNDFDDFADADRNVRGHFLGWDRARRCEISDQLRRCCFTGRTNTPLTGAVSGQTGQVSVSAIILQLR